MVGESYQNLFWKRWCMLCLKLHFQNYNKIDNICKAGSLPFVTTKTNSSTGLMWKWPYVVLGRKNRRNAVADEQTPVSHCD